MKNNRILIITIVLATVLVLAAAAFWLDLRAARANTTSQSSVTTVSAGVEQGAPKPPINSLVVYVEEPWYLFGSVRQGVVKGIQDTHSIPGLSVAGEMPEMVDGPVLYVRAVPRQFFWLPVFSSAELDVEIAYASDGTLDWIHNTVIELKESPAMRMKGTYNVSDTSYGIMTLRGQARHLGRQVAAEIKKTIDANLY